MDIACFTRVCMACVVQHEACFKAAARVCVSRDNYANYAILFERYMPLVLSLIQRSVLTIMISLAIIFVMLETCLALSTACAMCRTCPFGRQLRADVYNRQILCPIGLMPLKDPVILRSGHSYEREAILRVLSNPDPGQRVDPLTREPISEADVIPNRALKEAVDAIEAIEAIDNPKVNA